MKKCATPMIPTRWAWLSLAKESLDTESPDGARHQAR